MWSFSSLSSDNDNAKTCVCKGISVIFFIEKLITKKSNDKLSTARMIPFQTTLTLLIFFLWLLFSFSWFFVRLVQDHWRILTHKKHIFSFLFRKNRQNEFTWSFIFYFCLNFEWQFTEFSAELTPRQSTCS